MRFVQLVTFQFSSKSSRLLSSFLCSCWTIHRSQVVGHFNDWNVSIDAYLVRPSVRQSVYLIAPLRIRHATYARTHTPIAISRAHASWFLFLGTNFVVRMFIISRTSLQPVSPFTNFYRWLPISEQQIVVLWETLMIEWLSPSQVCTKVSMKMTLYKLERLQVSKTIVLIGSLKTTDVSC